MNRDQMLQQLRDAGVDVGDPQIAGMTDEQLSALHKQLVGDNGQGNETFAAAMKKRYAMEQTPGGAMPPPPPPAGDDMKGMFAKFAADCEKRFGAMEQTIQGMKPKVENADQFSRDAQADREANHRRSVEEAVAKAQKDGKIAPVDAPAHIALGLTQSSAITARFSAADGPSKAGLTPFEVWRRDLEARKPDARFASQIDDGAGADTGTSQIDEFVDRIEDRLPRGAKLRFPPAKTNA